MRPKKTEYSRLNREEKGEGIHFDMPHGHVKGPLGKPYDAYTDADCDLALQQEEPKCSSTRRQRYLA